MAELTALVNSVASLRDRYLEMCPLSVLEDTLQQVPNWPSWETQEFITQVVFNTDNLKYCPPIQYRKRILKRLNELIEQNGEEVSDSFAEALVCSYHSVESDMGGAQQQQEEEGENIAFLSYRVPAVDGVEHRVYLRTERSYNEVGMTVWGAGLFLAELCLSTPFLKGLNM